MQFSSNIEKCDTIMYDYDTKSYLSAKYEMIDGSRTTKSVHHDWGKKRRYINTPYDVIKTAYSENGVTNKKLVWTYTTNKNHGITIVKERDSAGKWSVKIFKESHYTHYDNNVFSSMLKSCKNFFAETLLYDSARPVNTTRIERLLKDPNLPQKALHILQKAIKI